MARLSIYSPGADIESLEERSAKLRVYGIELDETFLGASRQELLRAHFESGLQYACIRATRPMCEYEEDELHKLAFFCEANGVEAIVFTDPGTSRDAAMGALDTLSVFRVKVVLENRTGSFLSTSMDMDSFFRENRHILLCYNPAEMLLQRTHPFIMELISGTYRKNLFMIRVLERRLNGDDVLPITGDSELLELFSAAAGFGRDVWASIAPYAGFPIEDIHAIICKGLLRV